MNLKRDTYAIVDLDHLKYNVELAHSEFKRPLMAVIKADAYGHGYKEVASFLKDIDYIATLEAYVHWKLTGKRVLGIGDAAGMFPIDTTKADYNQEMVDKFDELVAPCGFSWKLRDIMP